MKVAVICETSGKVREAFRKLGHDVRSCDILSSKDSSPHHYVMDCFVFLDRCKEEGWWPDLLVAHPTCTYLTNAGVCWLHKDKTRWDKMRDGAEFFKRILHMDIEKIVVENPIMHRYAAEIIGRRQDQVIQPWMFGHKEKKATCLWLKGVPKLIPTSNLKAETDALPKRIQQRIHFVSPGKDRWAVRSDTFQGIADALAQQYGKDSK